MNIELRSEKTRRLLGNIPPSLSRLGIAVIVLITLAPIAAITLLPYPYGKGESILAHIFSAGVG